MAAVSIDPSVYPRGKIGREEAAPSSLARRQGGARTRRGTRGGRPLLSLDRARKRVGETCVGGDGFGKLAPEKQEVILMARLMGLSHKEIAAELGKSEVAVRTMLSRALAELADLIGVGRVLLLVGLVVNQLIKPVRLCV